MLIPVVPPGEGPVTHLAHKPLLVGVEGDGVPVQGALVLGLELALLTVECVVLMVHGYVIHHLPPDLEALITMRALESGVYLVDVPFKSELTNVLKVALPTFQKGLHIFLAFEIVWVFFQ